MFHKKKPNLILIILASLLLVIPLLVRGYLLYILSLSLIYSIFAISVGHLYGKMGKLSLGHGVFFAAGAYCTALSLESISLLPAMLTGVALAILIAVPIGWIAVKLEELYFAVMLLSLTQIGYYLIESLSITGGSNGLPVANLPILSFFGPHVNLNSTLWYYYIIILPSVFLTFLLYRKLNNSPFGLTVIGIRENTERLAFLGVNTHRVEWLNFIITGAMTGFAGAILAPFLGFIGPSLAHLSTSAESVMMILLGGPQTIWGPFVGAVIFIALKHTVTRYFSAHWMLVLGILFLVIIFFFPTGLESLFSHED